MRWFIHKGISSSFRLKEEKETDYNRRAEMCTTTGISFPRKLKPEKCYSSHGSWGLAGKAVEHLPKFNNFNVPRDAVNHLLKSSLSLFYQTEYQCKALP